MRLGALRPLRSEDYASIPGDMEIDRMRLGALRRRRADSRNARRGDVHY